MWNGNTSSSITSYYTNYSAMETVFTATCISGVTPNNTQCRTMEGPWWNGYGWGVNKGIYTDSAETTMLNIFNQTSANFGYCNWTYSGGNFSLIPGLDITITETSSDLYTFNITPQSDVQNPTYSYTWYVNGNADLTRTTNSTTFEPCFVEDRLIQVIVSDGTNVALGVFKLQQLTLGLTITENNGTLSPVFTGTGAPLAKFSKYNLNWYEIDIVEGKGETPYATTQNISGIQLYHEYQVELTNGYEGVENLTATYVYGTRSVIYGNNVGYSMDNVSYVGNNNNLGATPENAVKTLTRAYELINTTSIYGNIIVIMGNYNDIDLFDSRGNTLSSYNSVATKFNKQSYIIGKCKGTNYSANLNFSCSDGAYNGKFLTADTRFEYVIFNAKNGSTYFYLQGHDLTMGKGISMINYNMIDSGSYGQVTGLNSPHFH